MLSLQAPPAMEVNITLQFSWNATTFFANPPSIQFNSIQNDNLEIAVDRKKLSQGRFTTYQDDKNNERVLKNNERVQLRIKVKKWVIVTVHNLISRISTVYRRNSSGPSTEPWGTPLSRAISDEEFFPMTTRCVRPVIYDINHFNATLRMPCVFSSLLIRMAWSTASKAALRSRRLNNETWPLSDAMARSLTTLTNAVSVEWNCR